MLIRRALVIVAVTTAASGVTVTAVAPASSAAARHCATRADYRKVHKGMKMPRVNRLLHNRGKVMSKANSDGYRAEIKSYRTCGQYDSIAISFSANPGAPLRVDAKSAVWVG